MSILSRAPFTTAVAGLAIVAVVVAACSSAATPAPTPTPTAAPTEAATAAPATAETVVTPSPAATEEQTAAPTSAGAELTAPPGTPVLVDPFISAGIATTVDTAAHAVDPSTYRTTIPGTEYSSVYVVFALKPDAVGKVSMVMSLGDTDVLAQPLEIDYGTQNSWGDFKVNFPSDGIPAGIYKAVMTYEPTGVQVVQFFAVTAN
jgi:hypothetical protein